MVSICLICWDENHEDESKHTVITMEKYLQPQEKIQKKLRSYQSECSKMTELVRQWPNFVGQFQSVSRLQDEVMKSRTPNEVETKSNDVKVKIDNEKKKLKSFKSDILSQFAIMETAIESIFIEDIATKVVLSGNLITQDEDRSSSGTTGTPQTGGLVRGNDRSETREEVNGRVLVGFTEIGKTDDVIYCFKAVYNSKTRELLCNCFQSNELMIKVFGVTGEQNDQLDLKRHMKWSGLRGTENALWDICVDETSNTLYGVVVNKKGYVSRVEELDQISLKMKAVLDTQEVPYGGGSVLWYLRSKNGTTVLAVWDERKKSKWHSVIMYKNNARLCTVPLDIKTDGCVPDRGSVLMINETKMLLSCGYGSKKIAVVSLKQQQQTQQQHYTQASPSSTNFSATTNMKIVYLATPGSLSIASLVWTPSVHPFQGYLLIGGYHASSIQSEIFKVDFEIDFRGVIHGEELILRHAEGVPPLKDIRGLVQIDHSTVFAVKGEFLIQCNPLLLKQEFSNT